MKTTLAIFFYSCLALLADPPYFWTNGVPIVTNYTIGALKIPLAEKHYESLQWTANQWNDANGLTGTNRFVIKDLAAYGLWKVALDSVPQRDAALQAAADSKAMVQKIKAALNSDTLTDTQLSNIVQMLGL